ncbi:SLC27A2 [Branchiostoma lanceolatum]|uniref:Very long-chain fatty acid transport protein n=1 Tax=Branchiostoma lanceolatum TaxID=7740 RepID=A0A8J9ZJT8_BRALA|nr:SLC27A2 [Branchiostoma lanceolatum]
MVKPLEGALYAAVGGISSAVLAAQVIYPHIWRDLKLIRRLRGPTSRTRQYLSAEPPITIVDRFLHQVQLQPDKPFLLFEDEVYTYKDMDVMSNKVANFFRGEGYRCGDTVAMLIYNEPAFIWTFLGLAKLGVKMAFLNTNLRTKSLLHCFNVSEAKALIVGQGDDLCDAALEICSELHQRGVSIWLQGNKPPPHGFLPLDDNIKQASNQPIPYEIRATLTADDTMCYIYTSGTTGLPKPAKFSWRSMIRTSIMFALAGLKSHEVLYVCLPLYHSSAFGLGFGSVIEQGATLALARKFSARRFWDDCRKHNAAMVLYIGELVRYLCTQPKARLPICFRVSQSPNDRKHNVRLALGNGLSQDVWEEFQSRFGVREIVEFYGMTEAVASFANFLNKPGSVGLASPLFKALAPTYFLKVDPETNEVIRDGNGLCIEVKRGEPGLLVAPITTERPFYGYKGKKEVSDKKILRNVFKEGDAYFNTGDLMKVDKDYYVYFADRLGDTFRWKGENVATTEVSQAISKIEGVQEANVYGVKVPGHEGRAGMAAIVLHPGHRPNFQKWYAHLASRLPTYARPLVLRLTKEMDITGTFKHKKTAFAKEGFDPYIVSDPMYLRDDSKKSFVPLDTDVFKKIALGSAKL